MKRLLRIAGLLLLAQAGPAALAQAGPEAADSMPAAGIVDLPRRTYLGLRFDLSDRSGPGLLVSEVLSGSTAELVGLEPGDRLTSVGRLGELTTYPELREELARRPAGEPIPLRWYRGPNRVYRVSPPLGVLPLETVPGSAIRYDGVRVDGFGQRLIVSEPVSGSDVLVFYVADAGCESLDFWLPTEDPLKQLVDGWARAGFATARLEKRGVGDSEGPACSELGFAAEQRGYRAALARLGQLGYGGRIILFGHGIGGLVAPLVAGNAVAGIIAYGAPATRWRAHLEALRERERRLRRETGNGGSPPPAVSPPRSAAYFQALGRVDPARAWRGVWQPVLALHGSHDWQSAASDQERIAGWTGGKFQALAGMDHDFLRHQSLQQAFLARGAGVFDPAIVKATVTWIRTVADGFADPTAP